MITYTSMVRWTKIQQQATIIKSSVFMNNKRTKDNSTAVIRHQRCLSFSLGDNEEGNNGASQVAKTT